MTARAGATGARDIYRAGEHLNERFTTETAIENGTARRRVSRTGADQITGCQECQDQARVLSGRREGVERDSVVFGSGLAWGYGLRVGTWSEHHRGCSQTDCGGA